MVHPLAGCPCCDGNLKRVNIDLNADATDAAAPNDADLYEYECPKEDCRLDDRIQSFGGLSNPRPN